MGSGKILKHAINKHGIENFQKEYLAIFDNAEDMFKMESELVNEEFVHSSDSYNLKEGGHGGWDYVNSIFDPRIRINNSIFGRNALKIKRVNPEYRKAQNKIFSDNIKKSYADGKLNHSRRTFSGKNHSDKTKKQMSASHKGKHIGPANSQFGTMWITDRVSNKKISKEDLIPEGWMKGRI